MVNAVNQRGQHVVLFGERGVGKTSLAKTIATIYSQAMIAPEPLNCDPTTTFESMWRAALREIAVTQKKVQIGFTGGDQSMTHTLDQSLPSNPSPDDIRHVLAQLGKAIIVFDEVDRIRKTAVTALLADTIKTLSDHAVEATIILVGVADSVDTLIAQHQSIERALVQIRMPRMSKAELLEIVDKGLKQLGMTIDPIGRERIAGLSQGLPHYAHLLRLHASQAALGEGKLHIGPEHVRRAIEKAQTQAQQSIVSAYHRATSSPRENLYPQVLLACALAKADSLRD